MIRICNDKDEEILLRFLKRDSMLHTYIIADMERYRFDKPYQTIYMMENENFCEGVFLEYYNNLIFQGLGAVLNRKKSANIFAGNYEYNGRTGSREKGCKLFGIIRQHEG